MTPCRRAAPLPRTSGRRAHRPALPAPSITRRLIAEFATPPSPVAGLNELTPRELNVLKLVAHGMSNAEVAHSLVISEATVKTHVARLLMKLGIRDRVQAVVLAYESGIVTRHRRAFGGSVDDPRPQG